MRSKDFDYMNIPVNINQPDKEKPTVNYQNKGMQYAQCFNQDS